MHRFAAPDKRRPVLILTRESAISVMTRVTVAPITTKIRGIPTEVAIGPRDGMKADCAVNLDNIQTVVRSELGPPIASLSAAKMADVAVAIRFALELD